MAAPNTIYHGFEFLQNEDHTHQCPAASCTPVHCCHAQVAGIVDSVLSGLPERTIQECLNMINSSSSTIVAHGAPLPISPLQVADILVDSLTSDAADFLHRASKLIYDSICLPAVPRSASAFWDPIGSDLQTFGVEEVQHGRIILLIVVNGFHSQQSPTNHGPKDCSVSGGTRSSDSGICFDTEVKFSAAGATSANDSPINSTTNDSSITTSSCKVHHAHSVRDPATTRVKISLDLLCPPSSDRCTSSDQCCSATNVCRPSLSAIASPSDDPQAAPLSQVYCDDTRGSMQVDQHTTMTGSGHQTTSISNPSTPRTSPQRAHGRQRAFRVETPAVSMRPKVRWIRNPKTGK